MGKRDVARTHSGISFSLQEEGHSDTRSNINETRGCSAKKNQSVIKGQIPYDSIYRRYLAQAHSQRQNVGGWLPEVGGGQNAEFLSREMSSSGDGCW